MGAAIYKASREQIYEMLRLTEATFTSEQRCFFHKCIFSAGRLWVGFFDDRVVCFWGLIPPSLLSDTAYLWLYTTEHLKGHEFLFIRQSQLAVAEMLREYSVIIGHTQPENYKAVRWLRWLGASFEEPIGGMMPFTIRRSSYG